jgi:hypothetical protein
MAPKVRDDTMKEGGGCGRRKRQEEKTATGIRINPDMPVTYEIDRANRMIRTKCTGPVTIEEVLDHFRILGQDPSCPDRVDVLLDLSEQTTIPTKENIEEVTRAIHGVQGRVQFGAFAIVACQDALFGMLRMLEVLAEHYFRETYVFRTKSEAETWLAARHRKQMASAFRGD